MDPRDGDLWSAVRSFFQPKPPPPPPPPPTADPCRHSKVPPSNPFSHIFSPPPSTMARVEENGSLMDFVNASSFGGLEEVCMPFLSQIQRPPTTAGVVGPSTKAPDQPKQKRQLGGRSGKNKKEPIKKVVVHAPADTSNCSDNWAWRKYGQKPIKGSPYPRGYYRCSTNKSCPARKLVEKNWVDPKLVIITYTDEHDHPLPTHKSVLSGSTRNKRSGASPSGHSPTTPLATSPMSQSVEEEDKDVARKSRVEELEIGGVDDDDFMLMGNATVPLVASSLGALDDFDDADPFFSQLWNHSGDGATGGGSK